MKVISTMTVLVMGFSSVTSMAVNPLHPPQMGGDERLACEALMCLVNPASQPSECQSALRKFHSIKHKHSTLSSINMDTIRLPHDAIS